jgi:hypothetical protein
LPKDFVESTTQFFDHTTADKLGVQGWLFDFAPNTPDGGTPTYPKPVNNCTATATAHFTIDLDTLSPLLSNIPVLFWNMGKIELQLTFANLTDCLYWYSPTPSISTAIASNLPTSASPGLLPFPTPCGQALVPFGMTYKGMITDFYPGTTTLHQT